MRYSQLRRRPARPGARRARRRAVRAAGPRARARPARLTEVWAEGAPAVAQPHDRRGRAVPPWTLGAYAPAGCLRGTVRGALALAPAAWRRRRRSLRPWRSRCARRRGPMATASAGCAAGRPWRADVVAQRRHARQPRLHRLRAGDAARRRRRRERAARRPTARPSLSAQLVVERDRPWSRTARHRAGRPARRCPSPGRRSPTGRPPRRRAGARTSRRARRACP